MLFNVDINSLGEIIFYLDLEMTHYQHLQGFFYMPLEIQWLGTAIMVIIWVTTYPPDLALNQG